MTDELDPTRPGARFPYAAAAFSCACVAAAVWTFMLFSWTWDVEWDDFRSVEDPLKHRLMGRYVKWPSPESSKWRVYGSPLRQAEAGGGIYVSVKGLPEGHPRPVNRGRVIVEYPLGSRYPLLAIDAGASRWTGASVAGLVVGAMGVFIFVLHLRRWLRVRGLTRDAGPGGDTLRGSQAR